MKISQVVSQWFAVVKFQFEYLHSPEIRCLLLFSETSNLFLVWSYQWTMMRTSKWYFIAEVSDFIYYYRSDVLIHTAGKVYRFLQSICKVSQVFWLWRQCRCRNISQRRSKYYLEILNKIQSNVILHWDPHICWVGDNK